MIVIGLVPLVAILALIPAYIASRKGHSFGLWYVGGFLVWPVALVESLITPPAGQQPKRDAFVNTWRPFIILCTVAATGILAFVIWATLSNS